jgi:hypothetical protein
LKSEYGLDDARLDDVRAEVDAQLEAVEQAALAAPFPEPTAHAEFATL